MGIVKINGEVLTGLPPDRKEPPMIKLNMNHLNAVCHAEFYLHKAGTQYLDPHMQEQLENDLLRLAELKMCIIREITIKLGLFESEDKPNGDTDRP